MANTQDVKDPGKIEVAELDDIEHLLIWQKAYAFYALNRAEKTRELDPDLLKLYTETHSRDIGQHLDAPDFLPLGGPQHSFLCAHEPDLPLSVVVTSRNDTHVERMEERTQAFVDCLYYLAEKFRTRIELIIVEWNPPEDRPRMENAFRFPVKHDYVSTRILTVSREIHDRYEWAQSLPLYQMIAKNVGIRRARGRFIAATNIDILFSEELFAQITSPALQSGAIYRSNRWDVNRSIIDLPDSKARLAAVDDLHFQINFWQGIFPKGEFPAEPQQNELGGVLAYENTNVYRLHTEACGDFQMLHRDDWGLVVGYSELDAYSFHIDSLFALTCLHAGLEEKLLTGPHYHIDHTLGVKVKSDKYEINEKAVIKHLSMAHLHILDRLQIREGGFYVLNDENWGLAGDALPETDVTVAKWDNDSRQAAVVHGAAVPSSRLTLSMMERLTAQLFENTDFIDRIWDTTADFIRKRSRGRPTVVWGAGLRGAHAAHKLTEGGIAINAVVHGGSKPTSVFGSNVFMASDFLRPGAGHSFVVIASIYAEDIRVELERAGWKEGQDYIVAI